MQYIGVKNFQGLNRMLSTIRMFDNRIGTSPYIIYVVGASASGKTKWADKIAEICFSRDEVERINVDDYYLSKGKVSKIQHTHDINWDNPNALDHKLFASHIGHLRNREHVSVPKYSFAESRRKEAKRNVAPKPFIIVDGLQLLDRSRFPKPDLCIFIDANFITRLIRMLRRDPIRSKRKWYMVIYRLLKFTEPHYRKNILPYVETIADMRISNNINWIELWKGFDPRRFK